MDTALLHICQQLQAKKLKPSVALLRARSTQPLPLPKAIKAVQEWEHLLKTEGTEALSSLPEKGNNTGSTSKDELVTRSGLEKRLVALEKEIASIRLALKQLD